MDLTQLLSPYDRRLDDYTETEKEAWARFIVACLRVDGVDANSTVFVHANELYAKYLCWALQENGIRCKSFDFHERPRPEQVR